LQRYAGHQLKAATSAGPSLAAATDGCQSFGQPRQPIARRVVSGRSANAIVDHLQAHLTVASSKVDGAAARPAVADDVRHRLADGPRQGGIRD
jgi:hypothetical protein